MLKKRLVCSMILFAFGFAQAEKPVQAKKRSIHFCNPIEFTLDEDRSAVLLCLSGEEFIIPSNINSPDILRKVLRSKSNDNLDLYLKIRDDQVIGLLIKSKINK